MIITRINQLSATTTQILQNALGHSSVLHVYSNYCAEVGLINLLLLLSDLRPTKRRQNRIIRKCTALKYRQLFFEQKTKMNG